MHFGLGCLDFTNEYVIDIVLTCRIEKDGAGSPSFRVAPGLQVRGICSAV